MDSVGQEVTGRPSPEVEGKSERDAGLKLGEGLGPGGRGKGTGQGFAKIGPV